MVMIIMIKASLIIMHVYQSQEEIECNYSCVFHHVAGFEVL